MAYNPYATVNPDDFNVNGMSETQLPNGSWAYTPNNGNQIAPYAISNEEHQRQSEAYARNNSGDLMSWLGPALMAAAVGAAAFSGAGVAGGAEGAGSGIGGAGGGAAGFPTTAAEIEAANAAAGTGASAGASSMPSWATNYLNSIGTPQWFAQQAGSTALSQFANGGGGGGADSLGNWGGQENSSGYLIGGTGATDAAAGGFNLGQFGTNAIGSLLSGGISALGANAAGRQQANAANNAALTNLAMFNTVNSQQAPWRQAGMNALNDIGRLQPQFQHQFDANDLKTNLAPNYQFQLDQGLGAVKNAANLQGGMLSGNTLKGINDYAQNFAGNAYQQAFNNYNTNQTNIFNRLSNIAGLGQTANASTASAGTQAAGNAGNAQTAAGAAQAAGTVGSTNALTGGANNALGWYTLPQLMNFGGSNG